MTATDIGGLFSWDGREMLGGTLDDNNNNNNNNNVILSIYARSGSGWGFWLELRSRADCRPVAMLAAGNHMARHVVVGGYEHQPSVL